MTIKMRVIFSIFGVLILVAGMFIATWTVISSQKDDSVVINLAGRQRMLSQKLAKDVLLSKTEAGKGNKALQSRIESTKAVFEATLAALTNSGNAPTTLNPAGPFANLPAPSATVKSKLDQVNELWIEYKSLIDAGIDTSDPAKLKEFDAASLEVLKTMNSAVVLMQKEAEAGVSKLLWIQLFSVALIALALGMLLFNVRRHMLAPLDKLGAYAEGVAKGNLDTETPDRFIEEYERLRVSIINMVENLKNTMAEAESAAKNAKVQTAEAQKALATAEARDEEIKTMVATMSKAAFDAGILSDSVADAINELNEQVALASQGVDVQRDRMTETATAMEEMNSTVLEVANNAANAAESANLSKDNATTGAEGVRKAVASIMAVQEETLGLKESMSKLGDQADNIGKIMTVITDIADQTNLLALNAAIEAARAGEAGRGFAVVADEVRKLAEKTMTATKEVGDAVKLIQDLAHQNVKAVEVAADGIVESTQTANQSGQFMDEIVGIVDDTANQIHSIAAASEEQSAAAEEINRAVSDVTQIANETADGMATSARAVQEIFGLTSELNSIIQSMAEGTVGKSAEEEAVASGPELMKWSDELSVRIPSIDKQHKTLVKMINELNGAMVSGLSDDAAKNIIYRLRDYTEKHFGYEENLFKKYGYIDDNHIKAHRTFEATVAQFADDFAMAKVGLSDDLMVFLKEWLVKHIMGTDQLYVEHLLEKGVK